MFSDVPEYLITLNLTRAEMLTEGPTEHEMATVGAHFNYLVQLYEAGRLAFAGRTQDDGPNTVGLAVIRAESQEEAEGMLARDPAIVGGVFKGKVQPYGFAIGGEKMWPGG